MRDNFLPRVTVIMPAFNAAKYISESIASVQQQTMHDWELIVVDDGSTDNTAEIVSKHAVGDCRIRFYHQDNGKQGKARNLALSHAQADWVAFLDADDLWLPDKLSRQLEISKLHPEVDLIFTGGESFNKDLGEIEEVKLSRYGLLDRDEIYAAILKGYSLPVLSVLVKRSWVKKVGGFGEDLPMQNAEDYQLWLKLADAGIKMYGLNERLFSYRIHSQQTTFQDGINLPNVIWALHYVDLNRVTKKDKKRLMEQRLNRYLVHYIDSLGAEGLKQIIRLYIKPLGKPLVYIKLKCCMFFGKAFFKKWAYKELNLVIDLPPLVN